MRQTVIQYEFPDSNQSEALDTKIALQTNLHRAFIPKSKMRVEGHRGMGLMEPENTMRAFKRAIEHGLDGVELDVWLTMDEIPVVVHGKDDDGRVTFVDKIELIERMTLEEIRKLRLEIGEYIPTLKEVLEACKDKIVVNIEFKGENLALVEKVMEVINELQMWNEIIFSSFHFPFYEKVNTVLETMDIKHRVYFGFLIWKMEDFINYEKNEFKAHDSLNLDIQLLIDHREIILEYIRKAKERHQKIKFYFPMTLKETAELYDDLLALEVDTIITNYPIELMQYLTKTERSALINVSNNTITTTIQEISNDIFIQTTEIIQDQQNLISLENKEIIQIAENTIQNNDLQYYFVKTSTQNYE